MADLDVLLLGIVVSFVATAGFYVGIRDQFGYRDGHRVQARADTPRPLTQGPRAAGPEPRRALNG